MNSSDLCEAFMATLALPMAERESVFNFLNSYQERKERHQVRVYQENQMERVSAGHSQFLTTCKEAFAPPSGMQSVGTSPAHSLKGGGLAPDTPL